MVFEIIEAKKQPKNKKTTENIFTCFFNFNLFLIHNWVIIVNPREGSTNTVIFGVNPRYTPPNVLVMIQNC
jgi:hypothetical protein